MFAFLQINNNKKTKQKKKREYKPEFNQVSLENTERGIMLNNTVWEILLKNDSVSSTIKKKMGREKEIPMDTYGKRYPCNVRYMSNKCHVQTEKFS